MYSDNPQKQEEVYNKYKEYLIPVSRLAANSKDLETAWCYLNCFYRYSSSQKIFSLAK